MTPVSSATTALLILQQPTVASGAAQSPATGTDLTAIANGQAVQGPSASTSAQTADALFSVNSPNLNKLKMDLFKRVGEALGVKESDYATPEDYGAALKKAVGQMKLDPNGQQEIAGIEKDLGLDKLGVSLDTVINAIVDPKGDDAKKLDAALEKQINDGQASDRSFGIKSDDIGIYTPNSH
jgi:hypothetical protein